MRHFKLSFNPNEWNVTAFYPYTSVVGDRLCEQSWNHTTDDEDFLNNLWKVMWRKAEDLGCHMDNKIVLRLMKNNKFCISTLYLGMYDGKVSLGLSMTQDEWLEGDGRNKYFSID